MKNSVFAIILIALIASTIIFVKAENSELHDFLVGKNPNSLYSYKLGSLVLGKGEQIWIMCISNQYQLFRIELLSPKGELIKIAIVKSNEASNLYNFLDEEYGIYTIKIFNKNLALILSYEVYYMNSEIKINYLIKNYNLINDTLSLIFEAEIAMNYFVNGSNISVALIYPGSFTNKSGGTVVAIAGEEAQRRIEKIGFSIIEQRLEQNSITIIPMIFNETIGLRSYTFDNLVATISNTVTFKKNLPKTYLFINEPNIISKISMENFITNNNINFDISKLATKISMISFELIYQNRSPFINYKYNTKFLINKENNSINVYQILSLKNIIGNRTNSSMILKGEISIKLPYLLFEQPDVIKNLYFAIIFEKYGIFNADISKLEGKIAALKIYNNVTRSFLQDFQIRLKGKSSNYNDTAYIFYNETPYDLSIIKNGAEIPKELINVPEIIDYSVNIVSGFFYKLDINVVVNQNPAYNATLSIYFKDRIIYNNTLKEGFAKLILPKGNYTLLIKKKGFRDYNASLNLNSDKELIIGLVEEISNQSNAEQIYIVLLSSILVIQVLLNLFLFIRVRKS